jgi:hypothetical protein
LGSFSNTRVLTATASPANQAAQLLLNGGVGGIGFEVTFHVPDGAIQIALVLARDGLIELLAFDQLVDFPRIAA